MRKILLTLICLLALNTVYASNSVSFIYINGSNNNDEKMKNWYEEGVKKLHPVLRKKFTENKTIKEYYSANGGLDVKQEPVIFFWGDRSKADLDYVKGQLDFSKAISSTGAYIARSLIAQYLHDAIWVQKSHNMIPILEELNTYVKKEADEGRDVILYGYSAGSFVTYEYLINKLRYIKPAEMFKAFNMDEDFLSFVKENPKKDTCISALSYNYAGIGTVSESGEVILNQNVEQLKENYLKLDEMTELACAPDKHLRGIVNFASPLVLFYSDLADSEYRLNYCTKIMTKYIFENGIFWLTVNFREDPLGFPTSRNLTWQEISDKLNLQIENPTGVIYDDSSVWSRRLFAFAHTSYWSAKSVFAKAIVKSFVNGYKFQYDKEYQDKVLKKDSSRTELLDSL